MSDISYCLGDIGEIRPVTLALTEDGESKGECKVSQPFRVIEGTWDVSEIYIYGYRLYTTGGSPAEGNLTIEVREDNETGTLLGSYTISRLNFEAGGYSQRSVAVTGLTLSSGNDYCLVISCPYGFHNSDTGDYDSIGIIADSETPIPEPQSAYAQYYHTSGSEAGWNPWVWIGHYNYNFSRLYVVGTEHLPVPEKPVNPTPTTETTDIKLSYPTIEWEDGGGATSYDVYFGTESGNLTLIESGVTALSYSMPIPLAYSLNYYWRIDAVNEVGTTTGDEWYFVVVTFKPPLSSGLTFSGDPTDENNGISGTPNGENNVYTVRRLVVAANNKIWYEDL